MKNFMNFVGIMLGAVMLCDKATDENYNFEAGMKKQEEKDGKVEASAVTEAKKQIQQEQLECESREVKRRIQDCEKAVSRAERYGRFASKHKNIMKDFSEGLKKAQAEFESTGDYKAWDKKYLELTDKKDDAIAKAKEEIFGSRYENIYL
ncbi:hypothetical protein OJM09_gp49 [uncultured phage cr12_1]|uniref:Uncharacterized protein n=1 Tax=uncultured phage cr12_1 TaxID=2986409 RepID=A0AAE7S1X5_9CAUD|nr:hypothetical protein OJM09_gp49 [uncultured phage cr12_1]QWM90682.1 hypothetical protein [uncultured phage cr12_1]